MPASAACAAPSSPIRTSDGRGRQALRAARADWLGLARLRLSRRAARARAQAGDQARLPADRRSRSQDRRRGSAREGSVARSTSGRLTPSRPTSSTPSPTARSTSRWSCRPAVASPSCSGVEGAARLAARAPHPARPVRFARRGAPARRHPPRPRARRTSCVEMPPDAPRLRQGHRLSASRRSIARVGLAVTDAGRPDQRRDPVRLRPSSCWRKPTRRPRRPLLAVGVLGFLLVTGQHPFAERAQLRRPGQRAHVKTVPPPRLDDQARSESRRTSTRSSPAASRRIRSGAIPMRRRSPRLLTSRSRARRRTSATLLRATPATKTRCSPDPQYREVARQTTAITFHIGQNEGERWQRDRARWSRDYILAEVAKCGVLCANCHLKHHWDAKRRKCRGDRTRTCDSVDPNVARYQIALHPVSDWITRYSEAHSQRPTRRGGYFFLSPAGAAPHRRRASASSASCRRPTRSSCAASSSRG